MDISREEFDICRICRLNGADFFFSSDVTSRPPMRGNAICPGDSLHPCGKHSADSLIKIFFFCLINGVFKAEVCLARQNVAAEAK